MMVLFRAVARLVQALRKLAWERLAGPEQVRRLRIREAEAFIFGISEKEIEEDRKTGPVQEWISQLQQRLRASLNRH